MRLAIVGTAAAAAIGGTLAVAPLTLSTPERVAGGTCSAGQQCDRLAAVLMPDTATPSGPAAAEHAVPAPFEPVADTIAPGLVPRPGVPAAAAVPRVGPPAVPGLPNIPGAAGPALPPPPALPNLAAPSVPGVGIPGIGIPGIGIPGVPDPITGVNTAAAVVNGVLGVGGTAAGVVTASAVAVTYLVLAVNALESSGILPTARGTASTVASLLLPGAQSAAAALPAVGLPALPGVTPASLLAMAAGPPCPAWVFRVCQVCRRPT
ncbi:Conserved membrane protein of uncharacterised function [Mycobacterium tuberculosis]|nr:Conserved membrane protein of uncharacterised function [Mycobacterium tuberculosis]